MMKRYWNVLAVAYFIVLSMLDIITTHVGLSEGRREGNPVAVMLLGFGGEPFVYLFKIAAVCVIAYLVLGMNSRTRWLWLVNMLMLLVVVNNLARI